MTRTEPTLDPSAPVRVLVVEDGEEYIRNLSRFLAEGFRFQRAGSGAEALALLPGDFEVVFLDMRFDRAAPELLLGDVGQVANRFNGDLERARRFLEDNQGAFILAALREAGCTLPVVFSYDFGGEPRRWANLERVHGPLDYLADNAGPEEISACLGRWGRGR